MKAHLRDVDFARAARPGAIRPAIHASGRTNLHEQFIRVRRQQRLPGRRGQALTIPPIEDLLPHRGTMLLLERVVAFDTHRIQAECAPHRGAWYADARGNMPAWIGIELMAQAIAAHTGLVKRSGGKPVAPGVLLGTRSFAAAQAAFAAGKTLRVTAILSFRDESGLIEQSRPH